MKTVLSTVKPNVGFGIEVVNMETGSANSVNGKIIKMVPGSYKNSWCCTFDNGEKLMVVYWERND
jgi:hypothetical protein